MQVRKWRAQAIEPKASKLRISLGSKIQSSKQQILRNCSSALTIPALLVKVIYEKFDGLTAANKKFIIELVANGDGLKNDDKVCKIKIKNTTYS